MFKRRDFVEGLKHRYNRFIKRRVTLEMCMTVKNYIKKAFLLQWSIK